MKNLFLIAILISSTAYAKKTKSVTKPAEVPAQVTAAPAPQTQELKVGIKGMVCAFCAQGIEKKFNSQPEVSKVEVSLENKYVKLHFKEGKSLPKEKITEILKDAGYEAIYGE